MKDFNKKASRGRSMTEVLTVIAIVGILSLAGFAGIVMLFRKNRANDVYDELQRGMLDVMARADLADLENGQEIEMKSLEDSRYRMEARRIDETQNNGAMVEIEISDIDRDTCVELLKKKLDTPFKIRVGERDFDPENPDYTVCDPFDEARSSWFISSAHAASTPIKIKIVAKSNEVLCKARKGKWLADKKQCCDSAIVAHPSLAYPAKETCCEAGKKETFVSVGKKKTKQSACCEKGETALNDMGNAFCCKGVAYTGAGHTYCCSDPMTVVGIREGTCGAAYNSGKWCCPSGNIGYCKDEKSRPECCNGVDVVTVKGRAYCCTVQANIPVVGSETDSFCCETGLPYYDETSGLTQCCNGTPYEALKPQDSRKKGIQCCESGKEAVVITDAQIKGKERPYMACCEPGQKAYIDGAVQRCCSTELVYDEKTKTYSCSSCASTEKKTEVEGAPEGQTGSLCCDTKTYGSNPKAYWDGRAANCCSGKLYVSKYAGVDTQLSSNSKRFEGYDTSKPTYGCCTGEGNEVVDLLSGDSRIKGWKHCCPKGQGAFWDGLIQEKVCCEEDRIAKGFIYGPTPSSGYRCCDAGKHAVDVEGKDYQACCNEGETSAIEFNQCCPKGTAAFDCGGVKRCLITDIDKICAGYVSRDEGMVNGYVNFINPGYGNPGYGEGNFCVEYQDWVGCIYDAICER